MINNRKGEKIVSVYWFVILFLVAAAVIYLVFTFYGKPYDILEIETDILTDKIAECLSDEGYIKNLENLNSDNFLEICNLNFNTENAYGWQKQEQYYVEVKVKGFESSEIFVEIIEGNINLRDCGMEGKYFPICSQRSFYSIDEEGNKYIITILAVVRKTEKNV